MNKAELIDELTAKLGSDRRQATAAVENVVDTIVRAVHRETASPLPVSVFSNSGGARRGWPAIRVPARR